MPCGITCRAGCRAVRDCLRARSTGTPCREGYALCRVPPGPETLRPRVRAFKRSREPKRLVGYASRCGMALAGGGRLPRRRSCAPTRSRGCPQATALKRMAPARDPPSPTLPSPALAQFCVRACVCVCLCVSLSVCVFRSACASLVVCVGVGVYASVAMAQGSGAACASSERIRPHRRAPVSSWARRCCTPCGASRGTYVALSPLLRCTVAVPQRALHCVCLHACAARTCACAHVSV